MSPFYYKCHRLSKKNCKDTFRKIDIKQPTQALLDNKRCITGDMCVLEEYQDHAYLYFLSQDIPSHYKLDIRGGGSCVIDEKPCSNKKRVLYLKLEEIQRETDCNL